MSENLPVDRVGSVVGVTGQTGQGQQGIGRGRQGFGRGLQGRPGRPGLGGGNFTARGGNG